MHGPASPMHLVATSDRNVHTIPREHQYRGSIRMKWKVLDDHGEKTRLLVFDKDDEVITTLTDFAKTHAVQAAHFTAIGAFSEVVLGYFDRKRKDYAKIPLREQVEV